MDYTLPTSKEKTSQEDVFHVRTNLLSICRIFYILIIFGAGGCLSGGIYGSGGLEDSSNEQYGWWASNRKDAAVDIGFKGYGLQLEVVRSRLKKVDSPVGKEWIHNYLMHIRNESDTKIKLFEADGSESVFTKTGSGTFISDDGDTRVLQQHSNGMLSLENETEPIIRFNGKGRLMEIEGKQYGNIISLAYGENGYLEAIRDAKGRIITFNYDPETHRLTSIRDESGRSASYTHDEFGRLTSVTNAEGITSEYTYDQFNNLAAVRFP